MNPSIGVVHQMEWELAAARQLDLQWDVTLHTPKKIESSVVYHWGNLPAQKIIRYYQLRKKFYEWLVEHEKKYDFILLRHSVHDLFEWQLAKKISRKLITVHHTLETNELKIDGITGKFRSLLEQQIGSATLNQCQGIIAVTNEILDHQLHRRKSSTEPWSFVYPNGIYLDEDLVCEDHRNLLPELIFTAHNFSHWHGLDLLLESVKESNAECRIHIVGNVSPKDLEGCLNDSRFVVHGKLSKSDIYKIMGHMWCGISSLALERKGMSAACPLKTREYLSLGLPTYGNYTDPALPPDFPYFRHGSPSFSEILEFAQKMRSISKNKIQEASKPFISKAILLNKLYHSLSKNLT